VAQISPEIMMQLSPATGHALSSPSFCVEAMVNLGVVGSANNPKGDQSCYSVTVLTLA
jgi:hypothetical protein